MLTPGPQWILSVHLPCSLQLGHVTPGQFTRPHWSPTHSPAVVTAFYLDLSTAHTTSQAHHLTGTGHHVHAIYAETSDDTLQPSHHHAKKLNWALAKTCEARGSQFTLNSSWSCQECQLGEILRVITEMSEDITWQVNSRANIQENVTLWYLAEVQHSSLTRRYTLYALQPLVPNDQLYN